MKCRLCLKQKKLQDSHIIPEFFYKPLYDDLHRFNVVSTIPEEKIKYQQKGITERLLCYDCEQFLSKIEDYARRFLYGPFKIKPVRVGGKFIIENVDYAKFKLFQLSLLWRASVSKNVLFENVNLGPHEEKLRRMLLARNAGEPHEYGCALIFLFKQNQPMKDLILQPVSLRLDGHRCFWFVFGGCSWIFVASRHSKNFRYRDLFLRKDGKLVIELKKEEDIQLFSKLARAFKISKKTKSKGRRKDN